MRLARLALGALIVLVLAGAGAGVWAWRVLHRPYAGWGGDSVEVVLDPGLDAGTMLARLSRNGVLRRPGPLRLWLAWRGGSERLHAGEYLFDAPLSPLQVLARLERGDVILHSITIPEGLTLNAVATLFADAGFGERAAFLAAFRDPAPVRDLDPEAADLEGYIFPETYQFPRGATPEVIVGAMLQRFRDVADAEVAERAEAVGLAMREATILASMIEKETSVGSERARISRVFHNRLQRGMKLQCDPTVRYALERAGRAVNRLSRKDLEFESPWNTYRVYGLPPGPIASAGRASLIAAVQPGSGEDLYFVAAPEGGHRFSKDLASHQKAVAAWRRYSRSSR